MSKESFSKKISNLMYDKIKAIESGNPQSFFDNDEYFFVALCLCYMTLSKEKIIHKDMKNHHRMDRLSQMVDTSEIDKVFTPGFAPAMPVITYARENNNLWILDNFRDSIMHGMFDIDESKQCIIIDNDQFDRELKAEIPFSWFIAYAKNDILSKKELDHFSIKAFYYNKAKKGFKRIAPEKEIWTNILYKVNIYGCKFNIKAMENRVRELFNQYAEEDIDPSMISAYQERIDKERIFYNKKYLVSFYIASEKVKETIEREFPGTTVNIFIDNRRHRFINKVKKRLPAMVSSYNVLYDQFNNIIAPKSSSLLSYLTSIIENVEDLSNIDYHNSQPHDFMQAFNILLTGEEMRYIDLYCIKQANEQNKKILRELCINIYGLATLVINHESLYNEDFFSKEPASYGIRGILSSLFFDYAHKKRALTLKIIDLDIKLFEKQFQIVACKDPKAKMKIQGFIDAISEEKKASEEELEKLADTMKFKRYIDKAKFDDLEQEKIYRKIREVYKKYHACNTADQKRQVRKEISRVLEEQIESELKYTYGRCTEMKDVLMIIRNCFSHIGRISMGADRGIQSNLVLNDFDNNGVLSGRITCTYMDLLTLLGAPYSQEEPPKKLTKETS